MSRSLWSLKYLEVSRGVVIRRLVVNYPKSTHLVAFQRFLDAFMKTRNSLGLQSPLSSPCSQPYFQFTKKTTHHQVKMQVTPFKQDKWHLS
jgi:hypothetical protein